MSKRIARKGAIYLTKKGRLVRRKAGCATINARKKR